MEMAGGEVAHEARLLNQPFRKHARTGRPLVVLKSAMSLDGKVATATGESQWISGEASRARAHRWRAECDAVAVGIGTARADDPLLTSRVEGAGRQPRRIVFDSELARCRRLAPGARRPSRRSPWSARAPRRAARPSSCAAPEWRCWWPRAPTRPARVAEPWTSWASRACSRSCSRAGPTWPACSSRRGEIDEARDLRGPPVIGGRGARGAVEAQGVERLADATRAQSSTVETIDGDALISARLREW